VKVSRYSRIVSSLHEPSVVLLSCGVVVGLAQSPKRSLTITYKARFGQPSRTTRKPSLFFLLIAPSCNAGRILVVDDDSFNRRTLVRMLKSASYFVQDAEDGRVTLSLINSRAFDAVITDFHLRNGIDRLDIFNHFNQLFPGKCLMSGTANKGSLSLLALVQHRKS
jgi:CheY-like chemotaxis protein